MTRTSKKASQTASKYKSDQITKNPIQVKNSTNFPISSTFWSQGFPPDINQRLKKSPESENSNVMRFVGFGEKFSQYASQQEKNTMIVI